MVDKILNLLDIVYFSTLRDEVKIHIPERAVEIQYKVNEYIEQNKDINDLNINKITLQDITEKYMHIKVEETDISKREEVV